ncbi:MAG: ribonuclease HI family protein [Athalassotoga sp.]|uniref:ribonuclease HI family protein n=1 Tax=Athalassotoga sp. TaxID=2022597 RepID=UPI0026C0D976
MRDKIIVRTDGGSNPNPGRAGIAFTVERDGRLKCAYCEVVEGKITNNEAEYLALLKALQFVSKNFPDSEVLVLSDSQLIVRQMKGEYKVRSKNLLKIKYDIDELIGRMNFKIEWNGRQENKLADHLVRLARGEIDV